jgi:hypothetical protein
MHLDHRNHYELTSLRRRDFRSLLFLWHVCDTSNMSGTEGIDDWMRFKNVVYAGVHTYSMCDNIGSTKATIYLCAVR